MLLGLGLLVCLLPTYIYSQTDTLKVVDAEGEPGSTKNVVLIDLSNKTTVGGVQFDLTFDGNVLIADSISRTARSSIFDIFYPLISTGLVRVAMSSLSNDSISPGTGPIIEIFFDVNTNASLGDSTPLHLEGVYLYDPRVHPIAMFVQDGWFHFPAELMAQFSADPTSGCAPLTVNFTDVSTGDIASWSWDFGDDSPSSQQNPTHMYQEAGTYTVCLEVIGPSGSDTECKTDYITVVATPDADFTADITSGCSPLTVHFTDQSTGASSWSWDFGDDGTSTDQNPSHTYSCNCGPCMYDVSLTIGSTCGTDTETKTDYIAVLTPPVADFSAHPTSGPSPLQVQFTDLSSCDPTSWLWDFGDGNASTDQSPLHTFSDPDTYTVSLTVTNQCGSDEEIKTDYIKASALALAPPESLVAVSGLEEHVALNWKSPGIVEYEHEILRYDDGNYETGILSDIQGEALAMRMTPVKYPCLVDTIWSVVLSYGIPGDIVKLYLLGDDGGGPGNILAGPFHAELPAGYWMLYANIDPDVSIASGDFYVAFEWTITNGLQLAVDSDPPYHERAWGSPDGAAGSPASWTRLADLGDPWDKFDLGLWASVRYPRGAQRLFSPDLTSNIQRGMRKERITTPVASGGRFPFSITLWAEEPRFSVYETDGRMKAVSGLLGYNVYRSQASGQYSTTSLNTSLVDTTYYDDTSVVNGITYYYVVTAVYNAGESGYSNEVSAMPQSPVQPTVSLKVRNAAGIPGTSDNMIRVYLENNVDVGRLVFTLTDSPDLLTMTDVIPTGRVDGLTLNFEETSGALRITLHGSGGRVEPDSGTVVKIVYDVSGSAVIGESCALELSDVEVRVELEQTVPVTTENGTFFFCALKTGDVNGDDVVDIIDVIKVVRFILGEEVPTQNQICAADANHDSSIDILDAVEIINLILGIDPL